MSARLAQTPPSDYIPAGMTDCMIECDECHSEWGWGAPVAKLEQLIEKHNAEFHAPSVTPKEDKP